ncbi:MAG: DUF1552 domain-containing protein [Myxococcota bacterium]
MHLLKPRTRRTFLRSLSLGAAAAPFIPLLRSHAADGACPKRLLIFHTPHGLARANWKPSGTESDWALSPILEPLAAYKDRTVVVTGLNNEAAKGGTAADHKRAKDTYLTASPLTADEESGGMSIDQVIADAVAGPPNVHDSLQCGVRTDSKGLNTRGPGQGISPVMDPGLQYDRVFGDIDGDDAELSRLRTNRQNVIDVVRADLDRVKGEVAAEDLEKIESHLGGLTKLEDGLASLGSLPPGCTVPSPPSGFGPSNDDDYPLIARAHLDVVAASLACDRTRVATVKFAGGQRVFSWIDGINNVQHDNCHQGNNPNRPLYDDLTATGIYFAEELAYLLGQLDAIPEGDGSVLDQSLVVWTTEMSNGGHDWDDMPITIVGGAGGALQTDRLLDYSGRALNDLWISLAQLMDVDLDTFGDPSLVQGALPGLA